MKELDRLLLERELHHVVCRYARACDERDWAATDNEDQDRWTRTERRWRIAHRRMQVGLEFGSRVVLRPAPAETAQLSKR